MYIYVYTYIYIYRANILSFIVGTVLYYAFKKALSSAHNGLN